MASTVTINLLGPFEALNARGARLAVRSRRSRAMLACLAIEDGAHWPRQRLATLLWHDRPEQLGRSSLRQELVALRRDLEIASAVDWGGDSLVSLPTHVQTDLGGFRAAVASGNLAGAASLWRGELLQGMPPIKGPFADWLTLSRSRLREEALECFRTALEAPEQNERLFDFEKVALTLLTLDPGNETAQLWLMRCSMGRGDLAEAIDRYRLFSGQPAQERHSRALKRLLDEAVANASRGNAVAKAESSDDWIAQINRQHDKAAAPSPSRPSPVAATALAVIPFNDVSPGAVSNVALADGLTEETTTALARIPGLFVSARQSCMVYKNTATDPRIIALDLGVNYLVEGSIEVRGGQVRANARLIDGRSGLLIWANTYQEKLSSFFAIRNRIVAAVSNEVRPALMVADLERALGAEPSHLDAWTRLQRANAQVLFNRSPAGLSRAIVELKQGLAIDPHYAMAHSLLAAVYTWRATWSASARLARERGLAIEHSELALRHGSDHSFVLVNCADTALYSDGNIDLALDLLNRATEIDPSDPQGLALLANARRVAGADPVESLRMIDRAIRISPRDPRSHRWFHYAGWCHWKLGELDKMEASARRAIELYSDAPAQWLELTCALGLQGRAAEAKSAARVLKKLSPVFTADNFFEIAQQFYGKRFTNAVRADYRALCVALARAM